MLLPFPIAGDDAGKFPARPSPIMIRVWIVLNRVDERWERNVFAKPFLTIGLENPVARQARGLRG